MPCVLTADNVEMPVGYRLRECPPLSGIETPVKLEHNRA